MPITTSDLRRMSVAEREALIAKHPGQRAALTRLLFPSRGVTVDPSSGYEFAEPLNRVRATREGRSCRNCRGFLEFGTEDGTVCVNCGRIQ